MDRPAKKADQEDDVLFKSTPLLLCFPCFLFFRKIVLCYAYSAPYRLSGLSTPQKGVIPPPPRLGSFIYAVGSVRYLILEHRAILVRKEQAQKSFAMLLWQTLHDMKSIVAGPPSCSVLFFSCFFVGEALTFAVSFFPFTRKRKEARVELDWDLASAMGSH